MRKIMGIMMLALCLAIGVVASSPVLAADNICKDADDTMKEVLGCPKSGKNNATIGGIGNQWISVILSFIGVVAVIMIVVGGIFYVKSMGDPGKTKRARDTIIYGVVGLVVALLAYAIVAVVTANFPTINL